MKTSELTGTAFDWAVAKCEGEELMLFDQLFRDNAKDWQAYRVEQHLQRESRRGTWVVVKIKDTYLDQFNPHEVTYIRIGVPIPTYSTDPSQAWPIIDREGIHLLCNDAKTEWTASAPCKNLVGKRVLQYGPTSLVAAMRCYVASKLGDEVDVPKELT